ncbi:Protein of unknown function [Noviherbaspirillum humi]|uniref:Zinc carboxypeptidase n=1 Tax=Noviherbaspirillum humi TaxID=1688639 RepID=A0A239F870_9BURK|nr:DUF2817 domain-containing protein [Noviherbaspirillum humi]SNS53109.1 Protein of unknown function [Noviherbaspirillum humi]
MLPSGYHASRAAFRAKAMQAGGRLRTFEHGAAGLHTDTAWFGKDAAASVLVIASGTHGVEGYAGAACQLHFIDSIAAWRPFMSDRLAFLLVHAVNPWGYLHDRRVTVEGVDLNRNFVDFPLAGRPPSAYGAFHDRLMRRYRPLPMGWWNEVRLLAGALTPARRRRLQQAVSAGQYDHPHGLFYGGQAPTESRRVWEAIMQAFLQQRRQAFLLDLHTGLGRRGAGELISYLPPDDPGFRRLSGWYGGQLRSMAAGDSVSAAVEGTLTQAFDRALAGESYAVGLEFGTRPALAVLNALRADHWFHHVAGEPARHRERVKRRMRDAFSGKDADWMERVMARFDEVVRMTVEGMTEPGPD